MRVVTLIVSITLLVLGKSNAFQNQILSNTNTKKWGTKLDATWSNGQAIREYQDFLASGKSALDTTEDGPSIIITSDPSNPTDLASSILKMGDGKDLLLSPLDAIPSTLEGRDSFPIYLCLPYPELSEAISTHLFSTWDDKRDDFVYCSTTKGNIEPTLKQFGLPRDATSQLLVGFSTPDAKSAFVPIDLCVRFGEDAQNLDKYAGESSACGKWRDAIAARLERNLIRCKSCFYREWRREMWEKSVFDAAFHLVGACVGDNMSVAEVGQFYGDDASEMAWQLSSMLRGSNAIALTYGFEERMFEYAKESGKDVRCTIEPETWDFVNGVFLQTSLKGLDMGFGDPAPLHTEYVDLAVNKKGFLGDKEVIIPGANKQQRKSIMREGNLRADGKI